ncbi:MAG: U32 family peptidase [Clostridiales bacterium]|nr:U32 family peptidase [Clostridiales bacterium]
MRHELLAPAGSFDICRAVLAAGADAVYLGGERYGARAFAQNFSDKEILGALRLAHLYGRKIYLTVNTLLKNRETGEALYRWLKPFYENGLDAIIVQDYGVFQFVREYFPKLPVHASTQMSVANVSGAKLMRDAGAVRLVPARELSLAEIRRIYDETGMEIECFVHGALCYCYSGQCLMSSMIGGRSGNRGWCAQPCRLPYQVTDGSGQVMRKKEKYPLSPKDLCAVAMIPKLIEAGVCSFKIEGRMKSLEYAAGVTQIYRKYLDLYESAPERFAVEEEDMQTLLSLGNRGGFTQGYYEMRNGRNGREMMTRTDSSHVSGNASYVYRAAVLDKIPVKGQVTLRIGEPMQLDLSAVSPGESLRGTASVSGAAADAAKNRPLSEEEVKSRLSKTGDTPFHIEDLEIVMDPDCFVPVGRLNELRRDAFCQLEQSMLYSRQRSAPDFSKDDSERTGQMDSAKNEKTELNVMVSTREQLEETLRDPFVNMISLDFCTGDFEAGHVREKSVRFSCLQREEERYLECVREALRRIRESGKAAAYCLPHVFRENTASRYRREEWKDLLLRFDAVWARGYDSLGFCRDELELPAERICLDRSLYVFSGTAYRAFSQPGFRRCTASPELNENELAHMPNGRTEFCLYGREPVMVSAQCVYKNYGCPGTECDLTDRFGNRFPVKRNCGDCYNLIYNSRPLFLFHQAKRIGAPGFGSYRIVFVSEGPEEVRRILQTYRRSFLLGEIPEMPQADCFTGGHFRRGVE